MRQSLENVSHIVREVDEVHCARLTKATVNREDLYASPHQAEDKDLIVYEKRRSHVHRDPPKWAVSPTRVSVFVGNYRRDRPGWIEQHLQSSKEVGAQNIVWINITPKDAINRIADYSKDA